MFIEDFISILSKSQGTLLNKDENIIYSFASQILNGNALTEKQANLAVKILKRYIGYLNTAVGFDITSSIENPIYKWPLRVVNYLKRLSTVPDNALGKVWKLEFPYNEAWLLELRKAKQSGVEGLWDKDQKSWIFPKNETNLSFLIDFTEKYQFEVDEIFQEYKNQVKFIHDNVEKYVPMITYENNDLKIVNFDEKNVKIDKNTVISTVFEARKYGILTWDDNVNRYLSSEEVNPITKLFLDTDPSENIHINPEKIGLSDLADLIIYMNPCVFVIPGGSELENIKKIYDFLIGIDFRPDEMAVMFRLPSDTGKNFNDFVRNNALNNPITENTKIVFLSGKVPKPFIKSNMKFNITINLGYDNVHYTMREFVHRQENLVFYSKKSHQKEFNFDEL